MVVDVKPSSLDDARDAVRKGKATAAIVFPKDFGENAGKALFTGGKTGASKPELDVLYDLFAQRGTRNAEGYPGRRGHAECDQGNVQRQERPRNGRPVARGSAEQFSASGGRPKALRDLLGGVKELNERQDQQRGSQAASGQSALSGGLSMPYVTREEAINSGVDVQYNGYAHSIAWVSSSSSLWGSTPASHCCCVRAGCGSAFGRHRFPGPRCWEAER